MKQRNFFVALGIPRGADADMIQVAYRRLVVRYRYELAEASAVEEAGTLSSFAVIRGYSDRRHAALMEEAQPPAPTEHGEVDRFYGGYVPEALPPAKATAAGKDLFVELRLSEAEARSGGIYAVHIPVWRVCPTCQEAEEQAQLTCPSCKGTQRVTEDHTVDVTVPPGVANGQQAQIPMEDVGLRETDMLVRIVVPQ